MLLALCCVLCSLLSLLCEDTGQARALQYMGLAAGAVVGLLIKRPAMYLACRETALSAMWLPCAAYAAYAAPSCVPSSLASFGLLSLIVRSTGLDVLLVAPPLLQIRAVHAMQLQCVVLLCLLCRLPWTLAHLRTAHSQPDPILLLLMEGLLAGGAMGGLWLMWRREKALRLRFVAAERQSRGAA